MGTKAAEVFDFAPGELSAVDKVNGTSWYLSSMVEANAPLEMIEQLCRNLEEECRGLEQEIKRGYH